jgi:hypothetical protein
MFGEAEASGKYKFNNHPCWGKPSSIWNTVRKWSHETAKRCQKINPEPMQGLARCTEGVVTPYECILYFKPPYFSRNAVLNSPLCSHPQRKKKNLSAELLWTTHRKTQACRKVAKDGGETTDCTAQSALSSLW